MKYKNIIVVISVMLVLGLWVSIIMIKKSKPERIDMIYVNEVVKYVNNNIEYPGEKVYDYLIIMANEPDYASVINDAAIRRDVIIDVNTNNEEIGSVIFYLKFDNMVRALQNILIITVIIVFTLLLFICIIYAIHLQNTFFKPFLKLSKFVKAVASGNLDATAGDGQK